MFGVAIIMKLDVERATAVAPLVDPTRVRMARELEALTQQELSMKTGLSAAALSQIENGATRPSPSSLAAIAAATGCPPEFFVRRFGDRPADGFFRSMRSAPMRQRRRSLARARLLHDLIEVVEEHVDLPELRVPNLPVTIGDPDAVEAAAEQVRREWSVEPGPIPNVVRLLERHGMIVVRVQTFRSDIDAFSIHFDDRPVVVLGTDKGVTARARFDAAHELGHQVMHQGLGPTDLEVEEQAQQFAAAFLMPASVIRDELPRSADWARLMELKARWRVSIQALLRRSHTLDLLTDRQYENARKAMSARGWLRKEPGDEALGPVEEPSLVGQALHLAAEVGYPLDRLVSEAALPPTHVREVLDRTRSDRPKVEI
jgi:Zn-dependent peptidase ImmA (M78 family)/transcriptional regulator with XRE-family HTH domain